MATKPAKWYTPSQKHDRSDLVFHVWPVNMCYITLAEDEPEGVQLDLRNGTWTFEGQTFRIGKSAMNRIRALTGNPLGVYDRTCFDHLLELVRAEQWVADRRHPASGWD
ncbi:MAG: hypothetical protein HYV77_01285 [Candidatus Wildermuthbacteria bacterium]|nr:hypothetical protein [Candidatus Wildermuthbacteria bacterium]